METGISSSTYMTLENIQTLLHKVVRMNLLILKLTSKVHKINLNEETFHGRPKMLTYTGLECIEHFILILERIKPALTSTNKLNNFQANWISKTTAMTNEIKIKYAIC